MEKLQKISGIFRESFVVEMDIGKDLYNVKGKEMKKKSQVKTRSKFGSDYQIIVGFESQSKEIIVDAIKYSYFSV